jgi:formamidopyrimidine-DNA glycosylase
MSETVNGSAIRRAGRRAKYLLLETDAGTMILHLGMSGSLRVLPASTPRIAHDHVDIELDSGQTLRFNDPRRFGSLFFTALDPALHPLLKGLAPEPLEAEFNGEYLWKITRRRKVAIKQLVMNARLVVGVGNIYASEALFRAGISPRMAARRLTGERCERLARAIRETLEAAIIAGGSSLRDYVRSDGMAGNYQSQFLVYDRAGEACRCCGGKIRGVKQGQRSTYYCPKCQTA